MRCYYDGLPCDCGAFDVANDCPRDPYTHEDDLDYDPELITEEMIDDVYEAKQTHQSAEECYDRM